MTSAIRFGSYDWPFLADAIGFEIVRQAPDHVIVRRPLRINADGTTSGGYDTAWMISENGGELNITKITYEPLPEVDTSDEGPGVWMVMDGEAALGEFTTEAEARAAAGATR